MNCLFLDIASSSGAIGCVTQTEVLALEPLTGRVRDHELVPAIENILARVGWTYTTLDTILCGTGPGGFTSLRIAVSVANTLSDTLDIPVSGFFLWELYEARSAGDALWMHATTRDRIFVRGFHWKETTLVTLDELAKNLSGIEEYTSRGAGEHAAALAAEKAKPVASAEAVHPLDILWMGELLPAQQEALGQFTLLPAPLRDLSKVLPAFAGSKKFSKKPLEAWYGREG